MTRRGLTSLAAALVLVGACAADGGPTPPAEETVEPAAGSELQQGTVTTLGEVRVGVYSTVTGTLAQVSIRTPDEDLEVAELRVGEVLEVGGYTFTLTAVGDTFARMLVVDRDGTEVGAR